MTSSTITPALLPLLADPSPCLRWLVLRHLLDRPDDDPEVADRLRCARGRSTGWRRRAQSEDGSWYPRWRATSPAARSRPRRRR
ncbi:MAG: hypothetical protein R2873_26045 [Caldilineaceae bacterium]